MNYLRNRGFTLIESVLSIALSAVVIVSLSTFFQTAMQAWQNSMERNDLIQHGRVAMDRMIHDLRYGSAIVAYDNISPQISFLFDTTYLENSDSAVEDIQYKFDSTAGPPYDTLLVRNLGVGTTYILAGTANSDDVKIDSFEIETYDVDAGDNLSSGVIMANAQGLRLKLTLVDERGNLFTVSSSARMRNKP